MERPETESLFQSITPRKKVYPKLSQNLEVDVAIIGGGITGMTTAYQLIQTGKKVVVLEAHQIGGLTTSHSTGNLYVPVQPFYQKIVSKFNFETAKLVAQARIFSINYIENNIIENNISCQFHRRPWFAYSNNGRASIETEYDLFKKMEIPIEFTNELPFPISFKKAIKMNDHAARFNPLQYVTGLAEIVNQKSGLLFENTRVIKIKEQNETCTLITENGSIKAGHVLIATHTPININSTQLFTAPYRSYVVAVRMKSNHYPECHIWDFGKRTHAICTHAITSDDPELLLVAGSHHKTGQGKQMNLHYEEMESFLRNNFPVDEIVYRWSAQHFKSADGIPYIGPTSCMSNRTFMATGYFADGLVYGTLAGIIISDLILNKNNFYTNVFRSGRFKPIASAGFLAKENSNVFLQYLKDYFSQYPKNDFDTINPGEGRIMKINNERCAVSRDKLNQLYIVSAICTHMKCIVKWNDAEQTWDCPCHGSRFKCDGEVIEGPATINLKKQNLPE